MQLFSTVYYIGQHSSRRFNSFSKSLLSGKARVASQGLMNSKSMVFPSPLCSPVRWPAFCEMKGLGGNLTRQ